MRRSSSNPSITPAQKLFNLVVSNYLNNSKIEPFHVPFELLKYANEFSLSTFKGTNYVLYDPETFFNDQDLKKLDELKGKLSEIKTEIELERTELGFSSNDQDISSAYKCYMNSLHKYNEEKDSGQALIGKLAQLTNTTTKELYPRFNLSFDD